MARKPSAIDIKEVYEAIKAKERSLAGICFDLGLEFKSKKNEVVQQLTNLCEIGFLVTERETENNSFFGLLDSPINYRLYESLK